MYLKYIILTLNFNKMQTQAKNWNDLPNLTSVHELTEKDDSCLNELQAVLKKYELTSKFGVALLHKHFTIEDDEVLLEKNNPIKKTLESRPIKISEAENGEYATTIWRFDEGNRYGCSFCQKNHCDTN